LWPLSPYYTPSMDCLCSTHIFLYSSVWENGTCLFFRIPYTAIWIFRVTLGNYPLHVIYAIPLKVFGFTLFEIIHVYNTKVMLYNITTLTNTYKIYVAIKNSSSWWFFFCSILLFQKINLLINHNLQKKRCQYCFDNVFHMFDFRDYLTTLILDYLLT